MSAKKRPVAVLVVACLYLAVGVGGFAVHFRELMAWQQDAVWAEATELLAVVAGVFLLRGQNWARWLALAWMAFHVAISFPVLRQVAMHAVIFAGIAWLLLRAERRRYFGRETAGD